MPFIWNFPWQINEVNGKKHSRMIQVTAFKKFVFLKFYLVFSCIPWSIFQDHFRTFLTQTLENQFSQGHVVFPRHYVLSFFCHFLPQQKIEFPKKSRFWILLGWNQETGFSQQNRVLLHLSPSSMYITKSTMKTPEQCVKSVQN